MSDSSDHRGASRRNWFIAGALSVTLILLLLGGGAVVGHMTGRLVVESVVDAGDVRPLFSESDGNWFCPDCIAVMYTGGAATEPYAIAVRDELLHRGWVRRVLVMEPGNPAGVIGNDRVDFFIVLGPPQFHQSHEQWQWRNQVTVSVSGGPMPWYTYAIRPDDPPSRRLEFGGELRVAGVGLGLRTGLWPDPVFLARDLVERLDFLDPAKGQLTAQRPAVFFGRPAPPPDIPAISAVDGRLIWAGPGYLQNQRGYWILPAPVSSDDTFDRFVRSLRDEGWQVEDNPRSGGGFIPIRREVDARKGDRQIFCYPAGVNDAISVLWPETDDPDRVALLVEYSERLSAQPLRDAMNVLLEAGCADEMTTYFHWMTLTQRRRALAKISAVPEESCHWYNTMARLYQDEGEDPVRAEQALRHAYQLAMSQGDLIAIHHSLRSTARDLGLSDLDQPMTREQLLSHGAVDLQAGPIEVHVPVGGRFIGFVQSDGEPRLLSLSRDSPNKLTYFTAGSDVHQRPLHFLPGSIDCAGWRFAWSAVPDKPDYYRITAEPIPAGPPSK